MRGFISFVVSALLLCGCSRQHENADSERRKAAELYESRLAQFAASNNATVLTVSPTNWTFGLTVDIEDAFKRDGRSIVVELISPDVRRDESGALVLEGATTLDPLVNVHVEALITTNMLPQIRATSSELMGGLWLVMNVESVRRHPIENDNEEFVLRGRGLGVESRPAIEWMQHVTTPTVQK